MHSSMKPLVFSAPKCITCSIDENRSVIAGTVTSLTQYYEGTSAYSKAIEKMILSMGGLSIIIL